MEAKIGRKLLKSFPAELMSSVFTDGKKFSIQALSRALGLRMRTVWFFTWLTRMGLKSGL